MAKARSVPRKKSWSLLKLMVGFFLLVPSLAGSAALLRRLLFFQFSDLIQLALITGAGAYAVMHLVLWKPIFMHVMGHELTHAFWSFMFGGRTKSLQVSPVGGQVTLSKTNFFVALAPYFFPFYTTLLIPVYLMSAPKYLPLVSLLIGFTLAFHLALTLHSLREHQNDLLETGVLFSLSFIYFMNLLVVAGILMLLAPTLIQPWPFVRESLAVLTVLWSWLAGFWAKP
jgi:hypothetical protein